MFASGTPLATRGFHVSRIAQATRRFSAALGACHALYRRTSVEINARSIRNLNVTAPTYVRCIQKYLLPAANQTAHLNRTRHEG